MTPTQQAVATICGAVLASAIAITLGDSRAADLTAPEAEPFAQCLTLAWDDSYPGMASHWESYVAAGWQGLPSDGHEALYSPTCF